MLCPMGMCVSKPKTVLGKGKESELVQFLASGSLYKIIQYNTNVLIKVTL